MSKLKKDLGTIQRAIQILAGTYDKDLLSFEVAKVVTVDTANWLCSAQLVSGTVQTTYNNIQLTSEKASNGFIQVPKVNSNVILAITWRNEVYVFMCSEIDALVFHQANPDGSFEEFVINCKSGFNPSLPLGITISDGGGNGIAISSTGTIQMNDGSYGGLVKVDDITSKLNNLENKVNDVVTAWHAFASNYVPGSPTFTGTPATVIDVSGDLTLTQANDIVNSDITQGPSVT